MSTIEYKYSGNAVIQHYIETVAAPRLTSLLASTNPPIKVKFHAVNIGLAETAASNVAFVVETNPNQMFLVPDMCRKAQTVAVAERDEADVHNADVYDWFKQHGPKFPKMGHAGDFYKRLEDKAAAAVAPAGGSKRGHATAASTDSRGHSPDPQPPRQRHAALRSGSQQPPSTQHRHKSAANPGPGASPAAGQEDPLDQGWRQLREDRAQLEAQQTQLEVDQQELDDARELLEHDKGICHERLNEQREQLARDKEKLIEEREEVAKDKLDACHAWKEALAAQRLVLIDREDSLKQQQPQLEQAAVKGFAQKLYDDAAPEDKDVLKAACSKAGVNISVLSARSA